MPTCFIFFLSRNSSVMIEDGTKRAWGGFCCNFNAFTGMLIVVHCCVAVLLCCCVAVLLVC